MNLEIEDLQEIAPSVAARRGEAVIRGLQKEKTKEEKEKKKQKERKKYFRFQKSNLKYKKERLKWQQERSIQKDKEKREAALRGKKDKGIPPGPFQSISSKDSDTTAAQKTAENVGSAIGSLTKAATSAIRNKILARREKAEQDKFEKEQAAKKAAKKAAKEAKKQGLENIRAKITQRALPPARNLGQTARQNPDVRRQEIARRMPKPKYDFKQSEYDAPRTRNEEYCSWQEEFLYELGDIRKNLKDKNDKSIKIDVMKGKNKITINPQVTEKIDYIQMYLDTLFENYAGSISMSRATPPLSGIKMSDAAKKMKQPGKYSAEVVRDEIKKMFLGSRCYTLTSNLYNPDADDGNVPNKVQYEEPGSQNEAYDPNDETFRQHSRETFTAGPDKSGTGRRTSNVLKLMAKMNADVTPSKKKKKKKDKKKLIDESSDEIRYCRACKKKERRNECSYGPEVWDKLAINKNINEATKREKIANAFLGATLAASALQSPKDFVRTGNIESPGVALMQRWGERRREAERNLDSGSISHPARNIKNKKAKKKSIDENLKIDKETLFKLILKKLGDEKKNKNYLLNYGYIGESSPDKSSMKCNKPQRAPKGAKQKYIVKACDNGREGVVRFGFRGMQDFLQHKDEKRRKNFKARHRCSEKTDKITPGWWACNYSW